MIYVKKEQITRYKGILDSLDTAIDYLINNELSEILEIGHNDVDGEEVFINRFDYETVPESEAKWEGHKYYADIHLVLEGEEKIGVSSSSVLISGEYEVENDYIPYTGIVDSWVVMRPGDILVVFPEDAHKVKVSVNKASNVKKAVIKVKVL